MARTLILCPTHDHADALLLSIASVRAQRDTDWRMVVICDGSPQRTIDILDHIARQDGRISYVRHEKGERFGEAFRDAVIREALEPFVCHLSDDDIWSASHLGTMTSMLERSEFAVQSPLLVDRSGETAWFVCNHGTPQRLQIPPSGLNNVAYRREAYLSLAEGWVAAPPDGPSDVYMWNKFLERGDLRIACSSRPTCLKLPSSAERRNFDATFRAAELGPWLAQVNAPGTIASLVKKARVMELVCRSLAVHRAETASTRDKALALCGMRILAEDAPANIAVDGALMDIPLTSEQAADVELAFRAVRAGAETVTERDKAIFAKAVQGDFQKVRIIVAAIANRREDLAQRLDRQIATLRAGD